MGELGKALRLLGYSVAVDEQKRLLDQVDVDGSGRLDVADFRTLMRMQRESELAEMKEVFAHYAKGKDKLSSADVPRALRRAGCATADGSIPVVPSQELERGMPYEQFWQLVSGNFRAIRERMRQSAGFTSQEVAYYRQMFNDLDEDGGGDIKGGELRKLMITIFPDAHLTVSDRKLMEQILHDVDQDGSGSLDFADFLRLMRYYHDEKDRKQLESMWEGFTDEEARQFRSIFDAEDLRKCGHLSTNQIIAMVRRIVPLAAENLEVLSQLLFEVSGGAPMIEFAGFLRIMRHLLDVDLGGINSHCQALQTTGEEKDDKKK